MSEQPAQSEIISRGKYFLAALIVQIVLVLVVVVGLAQAVSLEDNVDNATGLFIWLVSDVAVIWFMFKKLSIARAILILQLIVLLMFTFFSIVLSPFGDSSSGLFFWIFLITLIGKSFVYASIKR